MIKIKDLEKYFEKSFDEILEDSDIIFVADDIPNAWKNYVEWEESNAFELSGTHDYLKSIKSDFEKWVATCNANDLLDHEISTYERHFMLENGKVYYLNNID